MRLLEDLKHINPKDPGGWPWLVYGFCLPTMTLAHATFAINTVNHMFGSRRFEAVMDR